MYDGRIEAGLRIGSATTRASGTTVSFYAGGEAVKEFGGRDRIAFASGGTGLSFDGGPIEHRNSFGSAWPR